MAFFQKLFALLFGGLNDPVKWNALIDHVGATNIYVVLFAIIFAETGLVVTPFLPGDSLLFAIGAIGAKKDVQLNLTLVTTLLIVASIIGDAVNYAIGYYIGPAIFNKETGRLLNKKHLIRAHKFYERYGGKTVFFARFMPIIRTFAPFVAGIGRMNYFRFAMFNIVGGVAWVLVCVFCGYYFGQFEVVQKNFELVIVAIIIISILPIIWETWRHRRWAKRVGDKAMMDQHVEQG